MSSPSASKDVETQLYGTPSSQINPMVLQLAFYRHKVAALDYKQKVAFSATLCEALYSRNAVPHSIWCRETDTYTMQRHLLYSDTWPMTRQPADDIATRPASPQQGRTRLVL